MISATECYLLVNIKINSKAKLPSPTLIRNMFYTNFHLMKTKLPAMSKGNQPNSVLIYLIFFISLHLGSALLVVIATPPKKYTESISKNLKSECKNL